MPSIRGPVLQQTLVKDGWLAKGVRRVGTLRSPLWFSSSLVQPPSDFWPKLPCPFGLRSETSPGIYREWRQVQTPVQSLLIAERQRPPSFMLLGLGILVRTDGSFLPVVVTQCHSRLVTVNHRGFRAGQHLSPPSQTLLLYDTIRENFHILYRIPSFSQQYVACPF